MQGQIIRRNLMAGGLSAVLILSCVGCGGTIDVTADETTIQESTEEITIPASYLNFISADANETAEGYEEYCTKAEVQGQDVILKVTEQEKKDILEMNQDFADDVLEDFKSEDPEYSYVLKEDFGGVVYSYDENIESGVEARLLMGVTAMYALNNMIEEKSSDWSVEVTIENCHTGNIVATGVLPQDTISFGESEWEASYK